MIVARITRPKSEDKFIFLHYVIAPFGLFSAALVTILALGIEAPIYELICAYCLYFVISSGWVASYPALYASCPTLIISYIIDHEKNGVAPLEFQRWMKLKQNSEDRIHDALQGGLIGTEGATIYLKPVGRLLYFFFSAYKAVLGLKRETL
ncbi:MAG: hypothetical protein AB7F86_10710 [Bdellovibrionales bacterium]